MQWLIDMILALAADISCFHELLPPMVGSHWDRTDFTTVNWQLRDCTGLVPAGTKAILLRINFRASSSTRQLNITVDNETAWSSMAFCHCRIANNTQMMDKVIPLTEALTFKTKVTSTAWTTLDLTIAGWWGPRP